MIDCCELALQNGQLALRIALSAFAVIFLLLTMFFGYNLKLKDKNIELSKRTAKLEQKNGSEQKQLDELKAKVAQLEKK